MQDAVLSEYIDNFLNVKCTAAVDTFKARAKTVLAARKMDSEDVLHAMSQAAEWPKMRQTRQHALRGDSRKELKDQFKNGKALIDSMRSSLLQSCMCEGAAACSGMLLLSSFFNYCDASTRNWSALRFLNNPNNPLTRCSPAIVQSSVPFSLRTLIAGVLGLATLSTDWPTRAG